MRKHWTAEINPYAYFLKDGVMRLRGSGTMLGFNIQGPGHETTSETDVLAACERFTSSLRCFGTNDVVHLIAHRVAATEYPRRAFTNPAAGLIDRERAEQFKSAKYYRTLYRFYAANQDEFAIANYLKAAFFASTEHQMRGTRELQMQRFFHRVEKWEDIIASTLHPRRMTSLEMFPDLILIVNGTYYDATLPRPGAPLHHIIGQQDFIGGSTPRIGQLHIRPITLVYPWPKQTMEQSLSVLLTHPGELMLSCRFVCLDPADAEHVLKLERKHFVREANGTGIKQWFVNAFNLTKRQSANQDTEEQIVEIDHALSELAKGMPFGWATITVLVRGPDADEVNSRARQLVKDLADIQHGARIEDAMAVEAIKSVRPGEGVANVRRPIISGSNFSDLTMPIHHWEGTPEINSSFFPKGTPPPLIVSGTGQEPFHVPSHIRSVGNTIMIGPTTGGKSTLLGVMVAATSVLPDVKIFWLDRDYSSFVLTHAMDGAYIELATDNSSPLCPFQWIDVEGGTAWLFDWFTRLFKRWQLDINERQAADLSKALELAKACGVRTMTAFAHLIHEPATRGVLRNYMAGGQWAHVFDGEPMPDARRLLTTYEMRQLDAQGIRAAAPATELIFHGVEVGLGDTPSIVFADEAWRLLSDDVSRTWLNQALRTFRKYNAAVVLATQSLSEIANSDVRALLLESAPIKCFLPNAEARGEHVGLLYQQLGSSPKEIEIIGQAVPQRDYLMSTPFGTRLFRLDLGPIGRALCASTGSNDVARAREILAESGPDRFLDAWLHAKGLGPAPEAPAARVHVVTEIAHANGRLIHAAD